MIHLQSAVLPRIKICILSHLIDNSCDKKQAFSFFKVHRPPSRHKTPPRAVGLELPVAPQTPPKTQKDCDEYLHTVNLKGINFLINDTGARERRENIDSDYESLSSSKDSYNKLVEDIQDYGEDKTSPDIIISHNGKQIITPRIIAIDSNMSGRNNQDGNNRPETVNIGIHRDPYKAMYSACK